MSEFEIKQNIQSALKSFLDANLAEKSLNLFKNLGYNTKRQAPLDKKTYKGFKDAYLEGNMRFKEDKAIVSEWKYIDLLFQLSRDEITTQIGIFDTKQVDQTIIETYLFFVIELSKESYSRSALSHITREMNKVFPMPVLVLFKHGKSLTLAVINRRLHKKDEQKDVLEKVTLIKDINIENPHRAHIEILFDLSLGELQRVHKFTNFVELHNAWQKTLDTKELNKKFYKELSNWYFWAMKEVDFPSDEIHKDKKSLFKEEEKEKEHHATNLIRLLTRLLFVWFVKEKGLIPEEIFDEKYVANELLLNFRPKKGTGGSGNVTSCFYRAILQNLFFATLNQNMGKREFRKSGQHMNVTNLMRYERYFKDSKKFLQLVEKVVPFMNGGLFECLDRPDLDKKGRQGGDVIIYLDGFSDREDNHLTVPDYIFFGTEGRVDLSDAYGDKANEYKNASVKGLINILKSYKFTVAENTPLEEEIALDPELLGRVFENLLASYNPETKTTARKQTGSFYTPREIVNYMVDESLIAYLKQKLEDAGIKDKEDDLHDLISYSENLNPFNPKETQQLISAIDNCKILDPACGSGAFPMGILHKLVHILHKCDPKNALWKQRQIAKAQAIDDATVRDQTIADIEEAFENNELDYGRKLYLIENCIYGVDIQPIATQISKLRFFISLIVDQKVNAQKDNFGIRPLPNLETKFVAANTLIGIEKPRAQMSFGSADVNVLEDQLKIVRHRLFSAKTPATKRKLREEDKAFREKMGDLLMKSGWRNETARQLAAWDPYDQNASSLFFDSEWMFGLTNGFDVVIGNPPYGADIDNYIELFEKLYPKTSKGFKDIYKYFFNCCIEKLINSNGVLILITPNTYFLQPRYVDLRKFLLGYKILMLINLGEDVFDAVVPTAISIISGEKYNENNILRFADISDSSKYPGQIDKLNFKLNKQKLYLETQTCLFVEDIRLKKEDELPLEEILDFKDAGINYQRVNVGLADKGNSDLSERLLYEGKRENDNHYEYWKGTDIDAYFISSKTGRFVRPAIKLKENERVVLNKNYFGIAPKLLWRQTAQYPIAAIDRKGKWFGRSIQAGIIKSQYTKLFCYEYLCCLLNSKYIRSIYECTVRETGRVFPQVKLEKLKPLPIKLININEQKIFMILYEYIEHLKRNEKSSIVNFFERLIDVMVCELYFEDENKVVNCEALERLTNLPELKDDWNGDKKLGVIEKLYKELSDPKHPVFIAIVKMQEVPEGMIIEERDK